MPTKTQTAGFTRHDPTLPVHGPCFGVSLHTFTLTRPCRWKISDAFLLSSKHGSVGVRSASIRGHLVLGYCISNSTTSLMAGIPRTTTARA